MRPPEFGTAARKNVFSVADHAIPAIDLLPIKRVFDGLLKTRIISGLYGVQPPANPKCQFILITFS